MKHKIYYTGFIGLLLFGVMRLAPLLDNEINKNLLSHMRIN